MTILPTYNMLLVPDADLYMRVKTYREVTGRVPTADERVTLITITKKGNDLKEKCKDIPLELAKTGSPLTEKDVKELYRLLYKFLEG